MVFLYFCFFFLALLVAYAWYWYWLQWISFNDEQSTGHRVALWSFNTRPKWKNWMCRWPRFKKKPLSQCRFVCLLVGLCWLLNISYFFFSIAFNSHCLYCMPEFWTILVPSSQLLNEDNGYCILIYVNRMPTNLIINLFRSRCSRPNVISVSFP